MPHLRTLAVLSNTTYPGEQLEYDATRRTAEAFALRLVDAPFASGADIDAALKRMRGSEPDAMIAFPGGATRMHKANIAEFANAHGWPSMFGSREHCEAGGRQLRCEPAGDLYAIGSLCRSVAQGREARRPSDRAANDVWAGCQWKNRAGAQVRDPARSPRPR